MDERTRLFLCVLLSVGFFAVLGGLFGAVAGAFAWRDGRAAGTGLGLAVARPSPGCGSMVCSRSDGGSWLAARTEPSSATALARWWVSSRAGAGNPSGKPCVRFCWGPS